MSKLTDKILAHPHLGKEPDWSIAKEMGVNPEYVGQIRRRAGIRMENGNIGRWGVNHPNLGEEPNKAVAGTLKEKILAHPYLGKEPDWIVAKQLGANCEYVAEVRRQAGIKTGHGNIKRWVLAHPGLGIEPNSVVAKDVGTGSAYVRRILREISKCS